MGRLPGGRRPVGGVARAVPGRAGAAGGGERRRGDGRRAGGSPASGSCARWPGSWRRTTRSRRTPTCCRGWRRRRSCGRCSASRTCSTPSIRGCSPTSSGGCCSRWSTTWGCDAVEVHDLLRLAEDGAAPARASDLPDAMGWRPGGPLTLAPPPRLPDAMAALIGGDLDEARARALRIAAGPRSLEGRWLRALVLGHPRQEARLSARIERRAEAVTVALVDRAFVAAVTHHFAPDAGPARDRRDRARHARDVRRVHPAAGDRGVDPPRAGRGRLRPLPGGPARPGDPRRPC